MKQLIIAGIFVLFPTFIFSQVEKLDVEGISTDGTITYTKKTGCVGLVPGCQDSLYKFNSCVITYFTKNGEHFSKPCQSRAEVVSVLVDICNQYPVKITYTYVRVINLSTGLIEENVPITVHIKWKNA